MATSRYNGAVSALSMVGWATTLLATVVSGFVAAYLMYRRSESLGTIVKQTITNPVGSLVSEVNNVV